MTGHNVTDSSDRKEGHNSNHNNFVREATGIEFCDFHVCSTPLKGVVLIISQ